MSLKPVPLLIFLFISTANTTSGDKLFIEHADRNLGREVKGEQLRILEGNVHIRQDTLNMYCDRAVFHEEMSKLQFTGNVLIDNGHRRLTAEKIDYYPDRSLADCFGKVSIRGESDSLFSDRFSYDFKMESATANGHLYITDFGNNVEIWGDSGSYNAIAQRAVVYSNARLLRVDSVSQDSFNVTAYRLTYYSDTLTRAVAVDSVVIIQGSLRASSDSAVYFPDDQVTYLHENPFVWYENNELEGEMIVAIFDSMKLRALEVTGDAEARSVIDSSDSKTNILQGKSIKFEIENKKPKRIIALENAVSIYYLQKDGVDEGNNFATSDTIFIYFKEGELDSIDIIGGSEGIFYPPNFKGEKAFE